MSYILRRDAEKILAIMNQFPDHDAFLLDIDNSSGIGSTVTLTVDIIHNGVPGRFTVEVAGVETW